MACSTTPAPPSPRQRKAAALAADPRFRAAIDAALRDLREDNRRLSACVNGGIETILAARHVGDPDWSAFALGCVLLSLTSARDEHQH